MTPISDNLYDVAMTAIRSCQWRGTEVEKVIRALEELEAQHQSAVAIRAKQPLTEEAKNEIAGAMPGKIIPVIPPPAESKQLVDAVSTKEVEPSKPTDLDVRASVS